MLTYFFNLADLIFTLVALRGGGVELNPLMRSIPIMCGYKVFVVGWLLWWLRGRQERLAKWGMRGCTAVYGALCLHHAYFILGGVFLW